MLRALLTGSEEPHEGTTEVQFPQVPRAFLVIPVCALAMGSIGEKFCLVCLLVLLNDFLLGTGYVGSHGLPLRMPLPLHHLALEELRR